MTCSIKDLHCSVYSILNNDATIQSLSKGVYNYVPQDNVLYPYICIGRTSSNDFSTFDDDGDAMIYYIDIYGKSLSLATIYDIEKRVKELLSRKEDDISSLACCVLMFKYSGRDENPNVNMETQGRMLSIEFRVITL